MKNTQSVFDHNKTSQTNTDATQAYIQNYINCEESYNQNLLEMFIQDTIGKFLTDQKKFIKKSELIAFQCRF